MCSSDLRLERLVAEVGDLQSKLILLAGNGGKTKLLRSLGERLQSLPVNVGVKLGQRLAATPVSERGFSANELLRDITVSARSNAPLLLDNLEVLFEQGNDFREVGPGHKDAGFAHGDYLNQMKVMMARSGANNSQLRTLIQRLFITGCPIGSTAGACDQRPPPEAASAAAFSASSGAAPLATAAS